MNLAWTIARWEFARFFKLKDLLITVVIVIVSGLGAESVGRALRNDRETLRIAIPPSVAADAWTSDDRFEFVPIAAPEDSLRALLADKEFDAILTPRGPAAYDLQVRKEPIWVGELRARLSLQAQSARLADSGLDPEQLQAILAPVEVETSLLDERASRSGKVAAAVVVGLMLMGVFVGNSYVFVSITGEKSQRVTEQILAIIRPQTWIDGKILGLAGVVVTGLASYVVGFVLYLAVRGWIWGRAFDLPPLVEDPLSLVVTLLLATLGFFFWFTAFAAFAATINDPNSSSRTSLVFLPMLPLSLAFMGFDAPDSLVMKILSVVPLSSSTVMPVRLVLGEVAALEVVAAVVLLLVSVALLRRATGKIFGLGMLMQGKEPTLREMARWLRQA